MILGRRTVTWCVGRAGPWWSGAATRASSSHRFFSPKSTVSRDNYFSKNNNRKKSLQFTHVVYKFLVRFSGFVHCVSAVVQISFSSLFTNGWISRRESLQGPPSRILSSRCPHSHCHNQQHRPVFQLHIVVLYYSLSSHRFFTAGQFRCTQKKNWCFPWACTPDYSHLWLFYYHVHARGL